MWNAIETRLDDTLSSFLVIDVMILNCTQITPSYAMTRKRPPDAGCLTRNALKPSRPASETIYSSNTRPKERRNKSRPTTP